ncbi:extracellular solute-binding protein [bacterium]|nr:extracellular solute-binding protein [bacterium]
MKKLLLYIFIILVIIFGFLFCTKKSQNSSNEVVFWTLQLGTFDKYINKIIYEFEQNNPDIKIKWIDVPYSEGEKRTLASVLTDNPPDLVNLTPDFSMLLAQKGALFPIKKENLNIYNKGITELLKYNDDYFGIPFYATSAVTLYNKSYKTDIIPSTYTELFNTRLTNNDSGFLTMISVCENDTLLKILNKYNINSPETLTSDKSIKFFQTLKYLYDSNIIPKESVTQSHRDSLEKYMSNQLAFVVTGANFLNMIKENAPSVYQNTVVLPQLTGETGLYDFSLMNFVIPKKAHNKEAALKFALFLTNKENQLEFAKLTSILPVNNEALNDEYFTLNNDNDLQTEARIISAKQLSNPQPPIKNVKNKKELNTLSSNSTQEILINNTDIKETLIKFSDDWKKL